MLCSLPGGLVDDAGSVDDQVEVRPLSGREEELLLAGGTTGASLVTDLLSRCLRRGGGTVPLDVETARRMLVADRQFALLKIREATFGERVQGTLPCPWPDCGQRVAVSFSTGDVPVAASRDKGPVHTLTLSTEAMPGVEETGRTVCFRLPDGGDQEALSPILGQNEAAALTGLLRRCVLSVGPGGDGCDADAVAGLSPRARQEIEAGMELVAPHVDLLMDLTCVECGRDFSAPFDLQSFFFGELRLTGDLLYREVHYLAYHYHWSEQEIMEMDHGRRRRYVDLLSDEIERVNATG
jgi:hypothetical protein